MNSWQKEEWRTPLQEGDTVPSVWFQTRVRNLKLKDEPTDTDSWQWKSVPSLTLFQGKRVVLFAVPGAFTPTCSSFHLPGYIEKYHEILIMGIDEVYCISVNDAFVMRAWGLQQGLEEDTSPDALFYFKRVKIIPDGAAHFTRGMGMSCIWEDMGERSWRYSAVINNGTIEKLFVEQPFVQNSGPDPFDVSDASTMLKYLLEVQQQPE